MSINAVVSASCEENFDECGSGIKVVLKIGFKFELGVALRAAQHCCSWSLTD